MTLGQKLKKLRVEKDFTQAELVTDLNTIYGTRINPAMWSKWENDKDVPSLDNFRIISDYFRVSMDYLSGLTEDLGEPYYPEMTLSRLTNGASKIENLPLKTAAALTEYAKKIKR